MSAAVVIPARYGSTRFPGKMLADATGKPLIQHVYEQAVRAALVTDVIIATDDNRILEAAASFGAAAVLTSDDHPNGTSRVAEAVVAADIRADVIVNVQGDEPEIEPRLIDSLIRLMDDHDDCPIGTLASPLTDDEDPSDPNIVKIVIDQCNRALYFSRAAIPHNRDRIGAVTLFRHVGMYAYRAAFLPTYTSLPSTPLEQAEALEQLRMLEHGYRIAVAIERSSHHGIDTPQQYDAFVARYLSQHS